MVNWHPLTEPCKAPKLEGPDIYVYLHIFELIKLQHCVSCASTVVRLWDISLWSIHVGRSKFRNSFCETAFCQDAFFKADTIFQSMRVHKKSSNTLVTLSPNHPKPWSYPPFWEQKKIIMFVILLIIIMDLTHISYTSTIAKTATALSWSHTQVAHYDVIPLFLHDPLVCALVY